MSWMGTDTEDVEGEAGRLRLLPIDSRTLESSGLRARCKATMPPVRLRYATRVKPAARNHWERTLCSGHSLMESIRYR